MQEAKYSFNVKFRMRGYDCQFTMREEEGAASDLLVKGEGAVNWLLSHQAAPSFNENGKPAAGPDLGHPPGPSNGKPQAPAAPARLCPVCHQSDKLELIRFTRGDKELSKYKCQRCAKWLPDKLQPGFSEVIEKREAAASKDLFE